MTKIPNYKQLALDHIWALVFSLEFGACILEFIWNLVLGIWDFIKSVSCSYLCDQQS
jgi:hypothetical protein